MIGIGDRFTRRPEAAGEGVATLTEVERLKKLLQEWVDMSASMVVVDGLKGLPGRKKDLEARSRAAIGTPVPNFT